MFDLIASSLLLLLTLAMWWSLVQARRHLVVLREWEPAEVPSNWPRVSILITARDEERHLEQAARTLMAQDYAPLELVAVNDRSADGTGAILERLAAEDPRLTVVHIEQLPDGWLGKNNALQQAATQAEGDYLLMTDADVSMDPRTLRRAVAFAMQHQVDHLTILPEAQARGLWLQTFINTFALLFSVYFRPWLARHPDTPHFVGIGAFNMIRRDVFWKLDGMTAIRMRPDDDIMLGKLVKKNRFQQDVLSGIGMVRVPWYASLGEAIRGLEKNAFAGAEYRLTRVLWMTLGCLGLFVGPWVGVIRGEGPGRWIFLAAGVLQLMLAIASSLVLRYNPLAGLLFPCGVVLMVYTQWRATLLTLVRGGIRWRGTHYSLAELKANRV